MLGTDYTLRTGHLLFLLLVGSSVILGLSFLNEMYQRIQLQTDMAIMQRQTQHAISEKSAIEHKAVHLQVKLEALSNEMKRLQDVYEFKAQHQSEDFEKEKNRLLDNISIKNEAIHDLREQYESLKMHFDNVQSVMGEFERNQSRLLEKFTAQSTQCMNVISMMTALCDKGKDKFQKILPFVKENNALANSSIRKPENNDFLTRDTPKKAWKPAIVQYPMQNVGPNSVSLSGGKQHLTDWKPKVNYLNVEQDTAGKFENIQSRKSPPAIRKQGFYQNNTEQENVTIPEEDPISSPQDVGNHTVVNDTDENKTYQSKKNNQTLTNGNSKQIRLPYPNPPAIKGKASSFSNTTLIEDTIDVIEEKLNNTPLEAENSEALAEKKDLDEINKEEPLTKNKQNVSGGKQHLTDWKPKVKDLSIEPDTAGKFDNIQSRESPPAIRKQGFYQNNTEQENVTIPEEDPISSPQDVGNHTVVNDKDENKTYQSKKFTNNQTLTNGNSKQIRLPHPNPPAIKGKASSFSNTTLIEDTIDVIEEY